MDPAKSVSSEPSLSPRSYALVVTRILIALASAAGIVAFWVATGNPAFARRMFGEDFGSQVASYDATHQAMGTLLIVLAGAFAWICVGRIASSLLLGLALMGATYYLVATGPSPVVPLELAGIAVVGLVVIGIVVALVLPGPAPEPTNPWELR